MASLDHRVVFAQREAVEKELERVFASALSRLGEWIRHEFALPPPAAITAAAPLNANNLKGLLAIWSAEVDGGITNALLRSFNRHWNWTSKRLPSIASDVKVAAAVGPNIRDIRAGAYITSAVPRLMDIGPSVVEEIKTVLRDQLEEGTGPVKTAQAVSDAVRGAVSPARALTIARTEAATAVSAADYSISMQLASAGVVMDREWLATLDGRTRPAHLEANGQTVPVHEPFTVGGEKMRFPGDPAASADLVVNCRCTMLLVEHTP